MMNNNEIIIANKYKIIDMQLGKINLGEVPSDVFNVIIKDLVNFHL